MSEQNSVRAFGDWIAVEPIASGGQGTVYVAHPKTAAKHDLGRRLFQLLSPVGRPQSADTAEEMLQLVEFIREITRESNPVKFALKELHREKFTSDQAREKAFSRLTEEVRIAKNANDPALIRIVDSEVADGWFVMVSTQQR